MFDTGGPSTTCVAEGPGTRRLQSQGRRVLARAVVGVAQLALHVAKRAAQLVTDLGHGSDHCHRDQCSEQAVLDGRCPLAIAAETICERTDLVHVHSLSIYAPHHVVRCCSKHLHFCFALLQSCL